jgi:hypothetical protein
MSKYTLGTGAISIASTLNNVFTDLNRVDTRQDVFEYDFANSTQYKKDQLGYNEFPSVYTIDVGNSFLQVTNALASSTNKILDFDTDLQHPFKISFVVENNFSFTFGIIHNDDSTFRITPTDIESGPYVRIQNDEITAGTANRLKLTYPNSLSGQTFSPTTVNIDTSYIPGEQNTVTLFVRHDKINNYTTFRITCENTTNSTDNIFNSQTSINITAFNAIQFNTSLSNHDASLYSMKMNEMNMITAKNGNSGLVIDSNNELRVTGTITDPITLSDDFTIGTTKFTVIAASGNTQVSGTLGVTGLVTASNGLTSTAGTTAIGITNATGLITASNGLTSTAGTTTLGTTTLGTTDVTGLITASNGLTSTDGTTAIGITNVTGLITASNGLTSTAGTTAIGITNATGLITASNGLTSTDGTTAIGITNVTGLITASNGLTSTDGTTAIGITNATGLITASNGLTSTAGTTTLGTTTLGTTDATGLVTASNGLISTAGTTAIGITNVNGLITASNGLTSTAGTTAIGITNATGLITASNGLISTAGTTAIGITNVTGLITASNGLTSTAGTTAIGITNATGLITASNGLTSTAGTTTLGTTDATGIVTASNGLISTAGTTAIGITNVTGLITASNGLRSTAGTTTLGTTTLGITDVTGLITASNGLTSTAGTTTLGTTDATGLVTASNGLTSTAGTTTIGITNVTGLITASNGLTSTAGTTTLGTTDVTGLITASNGLTSTDGTTAIGITNVTGLITASNGLTSTAGTTAIGTTNVTGLITASNGLTSTVGTTTLNATTIGNITLPTASTISNNIGTSDTITITNTLGSNADTSITIDAAAGGMTLDAGAGNINLTTASGSNVIINSNATIGGTLDVTNDVKINNAAHLKLPIATASESSNGTLEGSIRYNSTSDVLELYDGTLEWVELAGGGGGGGSGVGLTGYFFDFSKNLKNNSELRLSDQNNANSLNYDNVDLKWKIDTFSGSAIADDSQDLSISDDYVQFTDLDTTPADSKVDIISSAIAVPLVIEMRCSGDFELVFGLRAGLTKTDDFTTSQAHLKFSFKHNGKISETLATANDPEIKLERHLEGTGTYASVDLLAADNLADVFTILGYNDYAPLRHKFVIRNNSIKYYIENKEITLTSAANTFATNDLITNFYGIGFNSSHLDFRLDLYQLNMYLLVGSEYLHKTKMDRDAELSSSSITTLKTNVAVVTDTLLVGADNIDFESDAMYVKGNMFVSGALHINTGSNVLDFQTITDGLRTDINNLASVQTTNLYNGYYVNSAMTNDAYIGNRLIVGTEKTDYTSDAMWVKGNLMVSGAIHVNTGSNILDFGTTIDGIKASIDNTILTTTTMVNSLTRDNTVVFQNLNHIQISGTDKNLFIGNVDDTPLYTLDMGTRLDAIRLPQGTTAQRSGLTNAVGLLRYNTTDSNIEVNDGSVWGAVASLDQTAVLQHSNHIQISGTDKRLFIGDVDATPSYTLDMGTRTDAIRLPQGTTAQQPANTVGLLRYNTTDSNVEVNNGAAWGAVAGGGGSGFPAGYIKGFCSQWVSNTAINITAGQCEVAGTNVTISSTTNITSITGTTGVLQYVYIDTSNSGTITYSTTAPYWDTTYFGWYKTGGITHRLISIFYMSDTNIVSEYASVGTGDYVEIGYVENNLSDVTFRMFNITASTTAIDISSYIPVNIATLKIHARMYGVNHAAPEYVIKNAVAQGNSFTMSEGHGVISVSGATITGFRFTHSLNMGTSDAYSSSFRKLDVWLSTTMTLEAYMNGFSYNR